MDAFAGASPFSVGLAAKGCKVTAVDSNPDAEKWSHNNFELNNVSDLNYNFFSSKIEDILPNLPFFDRIIMNNPTNSLPYLQELSNKLRAGGLIHFYKIVEKEEVFNAEEHLGPGFISVFERHVHPYSPQSSLMVFDISKSDSNVQKTNQ